MFPFVSRLGGVCVQQSDLYLALYMFFPVFFGGAALCPHYCARAVLATFVADSIALSS